jgi:Flp pilus assembly protein TadG
MRVLRIPRLRRRQSGAAAVEFALVAMLFITVLLAVVEVGMMLWVNMSMQYAVREAVRCGVTGNLSCPGVSGTQANQYAAVVASLRANSMGLYDTVTSDANVHAWTVASDGSYQALNLPASSIGTGGQIVVVEVDCRWPLLTPVFQAFFAQGEYDFRVGATMKNELS